MDFNGPGAAVTTWFERVLAAATDVEQSLADGRLTEVAAQLAEIADRFGCEVVTGASPVGDQIAGVLVGRSEGKLSFWTAYAGARKVLIVESVLGTGAQLEKKARVVRQGGATRVVGAAILADPTGLRACRVHLGDEVIALREMNEVAPQS